MNRKSLLARQSAIDYPCTPETKSRKPRKTQDLISLNFSTLDEPKSTKSIKTTAKKTQKQEIINAPPINAELPTRKILRARRMIKKNNNNEKSTTISQQNFDKLHDIIDKATDKYFEFQPDVDDNENNKENQTFNDNNNVTNCMDKQDEVKNKKSIDKPFKKRKSFIDNFTKTKEKSVVIEKQFNRDVLSIDNNNNNKKKKRHTIHTVNSQTSTKNNNWLKCRKSIHNLNETFTMDEEDDIEEKPAKKRRTYELDVTVNKIENLKILEQNNEQSKLQKSSSFIFEDIQLDEELKPSTNDRRDTFDILPKSTIKSNSFNQSIEDSVIDLCESICEASTTSPQKSPINKRLNFSNITSRKKNATLQEDSVIVLLDDTEIQETNDTISKSIRFKIDDQPKSPSKSKVSIFKTPFKKLTDSEDGFISSTPFVNTGITQSKTNTTNSTNKSNSKTSRVKLPNFALLHQKVFSQMEDIVEYEKRKIERAQFLLSGKKSKSENNDSIINKSIKTKKHLRFAAGCVEKEQPADFIPLPTTPMPKFRKNISIEESPTTLIDDVGLKQPTPKPRNINHINKVSKSTPKPKIPLTIKSKEVNNPFNLMVNNLFNGKQATPKPTLAVRGNMNRFGFRIVDLPKPPRKEEIKVAVVNKTKLIKKGTEDRRDFIKGVRSNRRFDLLMKMRNAH